MAFSAAVPKPASPGAQIVKISRRAPLKMQLIPSYCDHNMNRIRASVLSTVNTGANCHVHSTILATRLASNPVVKNALTISARCLARRLVLHAWNPVSGYVHINHAPWCVALFVPGCLATNRV